MAKFYPAIVDDFHNSLGEHRIFESLKQLSDDWNVYYSLCWQKRNNVGNITWGEADFTLFNPSYGILVIEVKSGGIRFQNGEWYQQRLDNLEEFKMKDPFKQADRSKYKFIDEIDFKLNNGERCFIDKAVWFPSLSQTDIDKINLPMQYNKALILSEMSLKNPDYYLSNIFNFYNAKKYTRLSNQGIKIIKNILMPDFNLIPSSSNIKNESDYIFYQLTNEQKKVLNFLENQSYVAIEGGAGTGKTFIAIEQARRFSKNGKVLFLCFNKYLYHHLNNKCQNNNIDYYNIHTFVKKYSKDSLITDEILLSELKKINFEQLKYKYLIIDEAQDIMDKILNYIVNSCKENNIKLFMFYDKNQMLYYKEIPNIIKDFDCKINLTTNCRNTVKILNTMNGVYNITSGINEFSVKGTMPILNYTENKELLIRHLEKTIDDYLEKDYDINDITILTLNVEDKSILNGYKIGKYELGKEMNQDKIFFTTSRKFKGLESNIIIVVDFNPDLLENIDAKNNFYVAISRARKVLSIYSLTTIEKLSFLVMNENNMINDLAKIAKKYKVMLNKITEGELELCKKQQSNYLPV